MEKMSLSLLFVVLIGCSSSKIDSPRLVSSQLSPELSSPLKDETGSKDSQIALINGRKAFTSRMYLASRAKHSLDLQYYIWHNDNSGKQLLKAILLAADRGVRIRLLLDNLNEEKYHNAFALIENHPMIEVRLVNPGFSHINHRMHNKAFIADNQAAIVGGRNIGDEYFEASEEMNFGDFDVLLLGPSVTKVSNEFDEYWNHERSIPIKAVFDRKFTKKEIQFAEEFFFKIKMPDLKNPFDEKLYTGTPEVVYDPPSKLSGSQKDNLLTNIRPHLKSVRKELILISPYFIPGENGVKNLAKLEKQGIQVIIVTNSLASNDVASVFGGYKKYREKLLEEGIDLYEIKSKPRRDKNEKDFRGSSGSTGLHGKVIIKDEKSIFVGSMNLDPRSVDLNSEMGIILKNSVLASDVARKLKMALPQISYKLKLTGDKIRWVESTPEGRITHKKEPDTTWWLRTKVWFSSIFISESLL